MSTADKAVWLKRIKRHNKKIEVYDTTFVYAKFLAIHEETDYSKNVLIEWLWTKLLKTLPLGDPAQPQHTSDEFPELVIPQRAVKWKSKNEEDNESWKLPNPKSDYWLAL